MSEPEEPKNVVLVKLDQVLTRLENIHNELAQIKVRLQGVEHQISVLNESTTEQWKALDRFEARLHKLETQ